MDWEWRIYRGEVRFYIAKLTEHSDKYDSGTGKEEVKQKELGEVFSDF